jgi:iron complex outermembrane recepter protein
MYLKLLLIPGFSLLWFSLFAQTGQVKGKVTTEDGKPAPYVSVQLQDLKQGVNSDEKGEFRLSGIEAGSYTLVASYVGFKTLENKVKIEDGKTLNIALELVESANDLKEIIVRGYTSPNEKPVSVGKINIRPMDLPQSIAIIDQQTLNNQQVLRMSDVLMNTNGIYIMGATGGYQEEIAGRGFSFGSSNTFKNGVRFYNGMLSEMSGVERVEVLKGSSAILFGNVAAGGILNLVTKKPKFDFGGEVSMRVGSFGLLKPTFDLYGGIGKKEIAAFRLNGSYEKANSFREGVSSERFYINPSLLVKLGKKTDILLEADYLNDRRTPDFGSGIINYQIIDLPRERFLGVPWSYFKAEQISTTATVTHRFTNNWKLSFTGSYRSYATDLFANTRPNTGGLIGESGTWIRNIQRSEAAEDYYLAQLDLTGKFSTGRLEHQLLLGMDTDQFETRTTSYGQLARYDTINIFGTKQYMRRTDIPVLAPSTLSTSPVSRVGVYVQDLVSLTPALKLLAGVRYSYQQTGSDVFTYSTATTTQSVFYDGAFSPRLGLVYQPTKNHSIFGSYANSFTLNTGVDVAGNALPPSLIDQYEVGVKNELMNGKLSVNATVYRILNSNLAQISLANGNTNSNIKELAGSVQSQGVEVDFVGRPARGLSLMAGYSYNETRYVKSNTYVEGSLLRYNPNHTANASIHYRLEEGTLKGLSLGLTGVYIGQRFAGRSTRVQVANDVFQLIELPSYTQLDGTVGYAWGPMTLRGKIGNIFNVLSYNVHDDNSVNPIAPRNYSASLTYKF